MSKFRNRTAPTPRHEPVVLAEFRGVPGQQPGAKDRRLFRWIAAAVGVVIVLEVVTLLGMRG